MSDEPIRIDSLEGFYDHFGPHVLYVPLDEHGRAIGDPMCHEYNWARPPQPLATRVVRRRRGWKRYLVQMMEPGGLWVSMDVTWTRRGGNRLIRRLKRHLETWTLGR